MNKRKARSRAVFGLTTAALALAANPAIASARTYEPAATIECAPANPQASIHSQADFGPNDYQIIAGSYLRDAIHFCDLIPGKEYTMHSTVRDQADPNHVLGSVEKTFRPAKSDEFMGADIQVPLVVRTPLHSAVFTEEVDAQGQPVDHEQTVAASQDAN